MRNLQQVQVRTSSGFEKICPFPIGYIYMSTNKTSPASTYGGTWSALTDSRFLRPSGSWNSTGGEATHTLKLNEIPSHYHNDSGTWLAQSVVGGGAANGFDTYWGTGNLTYTQNYARGGGQAHNNLPPYRTCYAWYRTA